MVIGIDLWGTLIKSSPLFKQAKKLLLFKQYFNISPTICEEALEDSKEQLNSFITQTGLAPSEDIRMALFLNKLEVPAYNKDFNTSFSEDYQKLAKLFPPEIYSKDTAQYLEKLAELGKLVLVSNTLYITGETLKIIIRGNNLDLYKYFDDFYFSSEELNSKPSPYICNKKLDYMIGDNHVVDGTFATNVGARFLQINSNDKTLKDAYEYIKSNKR